MSGFYSWEEKQRGRLIAEIIKEACIYREYIGSKKYVMCFDASRNKLVVGSLQLMIYPNNVKLFLFSEIPVNVLDANHDNISSWLHKNINWMEFTKQCNDASE